MWPWRKAKPSSGTDVVEAPLALTVSDYPGLDALLDAGDVTGALALVAAVEQDPDVLARADLQMRREAFVRAARRDPAAGQWPPATDTRLPLSNGLPEIAPTDLTLDTLVAGVRNHGVLIVRGLFAQDTCARLRTMIDEIIAAFDAQKADPRWNTPLTDVAGTPLSAQYREVNFDPTGRPVADSPAAARFLFEEYERLGLPSLASAYLGERAAVTLEKWTLRRVPPGGTASWHQDGAFLGAERKTLNMWVALNDCGATASGLDIVAKRFDEIVPTGTEGAYFYWDVAQDVVDAERGPDPIVSPVFAPGDAVFFDQFLLHRTGLGDFTEDRYALESWFFTPSSYPGHYEGLLL